MLVTPSHPKCVLLDKLVKILKEQEKDLQKTRFCCLDGTNSMLGEISGLQRRICHTSPHSIYVNCRCHGVALCFKHLTDQFSWLAKLDKMLLGMRRCFKRYEKILEAPDQVLVAKPNQESSRYQSDLLKPSNTVLTLSLLDDVLTCMKV